LGLTVGENNNASRELGADEDDFHEFSRRRVQVEREVEKEGGDLKKGKRIEKGKRRRDDDDEGELEVEEIKGGKIKERKDGGGKVVAF